MYIYIYIYIYISWNHLSNATCLTQAFFERDELCSKLW